MGNIFSTTEDLRTFFSALLGGRLLPPALTERMKRTRRNQTAEWPAGIGMGLGVWSWDLPCGRRIYGHEGEVPGSNTYAFGTADGRRTIVMQHNLFYMDWAGGRTRSCRPTSRSGATRPDPRARCARAMPRLGRRTPPAQEGHTS